MELWIRSQDKECLIKTNIVEIEYFGEDCFTSINTRFDGRNASLGTYKSKERAIEVLDEIEAILLYEQLEKITGNAFIKVNNGVAIYEMPKE